MTVYGDSRVRNLAVPWPVKAFPGKGLGWIKNKIKGSDQIGGVVVIVGGLCDLGKRVGSGIYSEIIWREGGWI